ncbi:hypothetical protein H2509_10430 [Stappia sp. F7233]|uniref:Peptide ABC transporter permease n=1 Tax=Stappia albiluteola TaxID=2758565 RepID=A0A839AES9_9HYPH|nr:hypothetical protein [Stappia albiluteola]MBA5777538.1 hypothetical protein [Stappia albiluteola]
MAGKSQISNPVERPHAGQDVRQGEIILRKRWQRALFAGDLAGIALLCLGLAFLALS